MLGALRSHRTVLNGDIISKEKAAEYAVAAFGSRWRPMIEEALGYCRSDWPAAGRTTRLGWS